MLECQLVYDFEQGFPLHAQVYRMSSWRVEQYTNYGMLYQPTAPADNPFGVFTNIVVSRTCLCFFILILSDY